MENQPKPQSEIEGIDPKSKERINNGFWELIYGLSDFLKQMFELQSDLDREGTITNIKNNKRMQGANVWLLICSIMVASIGLDLNSQAVIIGAMLISPLMSPILGIGLGVGINDRETLMISLQHFIIAIIIALITSVIYFYFTPLGEVTEQISARTKPTFLDAMVAVFGGLAGIVSSSRKDKSNAIPGVAIATALMPPLCVAGYGIAKWDWSIFINSFYLFFLNSVFIALTTYMIVRFLGFPYKSYINKKDKYRTTLVISIFSFIVLIPSAWILYGTWQEVQTKIALNEKNLTIENFIKEEFDSPYKKCVSLDTELSDSVNYITINYYSKEEMLIPNDSIDFYKRELQRLGIANPIIITRGRSMGAIPSKIIGEREDEYNRRVSEFAQREAEKDQQIRELQIKADSIQFQTHLQSVVSEAKVFLPHLVDVDLVESKFDTVPILLVQWEDDLYDYKEDKKRLMEFVKIKTKIDTLVVRGL